jgi:hypothetical protein
MGVCFGETRDVALDDPSATKAATTDALGAHRLEAESELLLDSLGNFTGNADATRVGELFKLCEPTSDVLRT